MAYPEASLARSVVLQYCFLEGYLAETLWAVNMIAGFNWRGG